jgi:endonuclease-3
MNFDRQKTIWKVIWPVLGKQYKRTKTFLNYRNTWELLVAVILSAQMTDEGVNAMTPELFKKFPTIELMAKAPVSEIAKYVRKVNYFNSKSNYLKKTAQLLIQNFNGKVPDTVEDLMTLSGVGRKTAVAVLANGFKKYVGIAVDTHVIRFATRFKLSSSKNPVQIEKDLMEIIPKKDWNAASYAIKEYGRKEGRARGYKPENDPVWKVFKSIKK